VTTIEWAAMRDLARRLGQVKGAKCEERLPGHDLVSMSFGRSGPLNSGMGEGDEVGAGTQDGRFALDQG
jgi:hypothetical protein